MKRSLSAAIAPFVLALCLLCGCAFAPSQKTSEPTEPVETEYVPTKYDTVTSITLDGTESDEELDELRLYRALKTVDARASENYQAILRLAALMPDCDFNWRIKLGSAELEPDLTLLELDGAELTDNAELLEKLKYFEKLERVELIGSGLEDMQCRELADAYPNVKFVWELKTDIWTIRTDAVCFSTLRTSDPDQRKGDEVLHPIMKYCTDLVALDLGHNYLTDLSPIVNLKNLKYLFLADSPRVTDLSPLAELTGLEYLEMFLFTSVEDFSPLDSLVNLKQLNISYAEKLTDPEFIAHMPSLELLWCIRTAVPAEVWDSYKAEYPDVSIWSYTGSDSSVLNGWRDTPENIALRHAFVYWRSVTRMVSWDDYTIDY